MSWPSAISLPTASKRAKPSSTASMRRKTGKPYDGVTGYSNYHELLANKDIDAVVISTPDHQHAIVAVDAVPRRQGTSTFRSPHPSPSPRAATSRTTSRQATASSRSAAKQRSWKQFIRAVELVRNGRHRRDHPRRDRPPRRDPRRRQPHAHARPPLASSTTPGSVSTPEAPYTLDRVMPLLRLRPPRLAPLRAVRRRHDHRLGSPPRRHRPLGHEHRVHTGPVEIWGNRRVPYLRPLERPRQVPSPTPSTPTASPWTSPGDFPNGIKWVGTKGWLFVRRDEMTSPTDAGGKARQARAPSKPLTPKILTSVIGPNEWHAYPSDDPARANWPRLHQEPQTPPPAPRRDRPIAPASTCPPPPHRDEDQTPTCTGDPAKEQFLKNDPANAMLSRPQRPPYTFSA